MAYDSLRDFVQRLDAAGELKRISVEVDPILEITEIADREMKSPGGGKALLFEKCKGSQFPLLINAYGSTKRMAMALGVNDVEEIARELEGLLKAKPPTSFKEALSLLGTAFELRHAKPKSLKSGSCKEVVQPRPNLNVLPVQQCWPQDAGRFVCLPLVITRDPDNGSRNVGTYRMQVIDGLTTFMHWQMHKTGARHWRRYMELKQRMPVAVALGGDPVYAFAATAPLPDGIDEMMFAGFLRKKSVEMVKCDTNDLEVPADCDFVLEGYVDPEEKLDLEGPFGDHTGYYTLPEPYPKFHVERVTHRRNATYPSTIVGVPPMEDFYMGSASVRIFLPVFKTNFNEIVDMALPAEGVFHNLVIVSIKKQFPYHAMKVMHGLWGMGQMMFTKMIVVVDADVNVHDTNEVLFRLTANIDPERDIIFTKGPADVLDHATPVMGFGSKIGIDATHKLKGEANTRPWPPIIKMDEAVKKRVDLIVRALERKA
ncbi:MAG TPA: menaquinone biosynthesis decarboxylase [Verrucomicrobiae bacterium]|nr:menaquinone biosynthesis decarboxylase [Verrucomicrobiae bacterium]